MTDTPNTNPDANTIMAGKRRVDLTGKVFGDLTVTGDAPRRGRDHQRRFFVRCACGKEKDVSIQGLTRYNIRSCGCNRRPWHETHAKMVKHGDMGSPEYRAWLSMRQRCCRPNCARYVDYGGRGIQICARWKESYLNFLEDMGRRPSEKHSIDRIDNNGNYEPGNCRWATPAVQSNNRRNTMFITAFGKTKLRSEWSVETGIPVGLIYQRLAKGWEAERTLTEPCRPRHRRLRPQEECSVGAP